MSFFANVDEFLNILAKCNNIEKYADIARSINDFPLDKKIECVDKEIKLLRFVVDETGEFFRLFVQKKRFALKHVPDHLITPELCHLAVNFNGYVIEFVPEGLKTPELCRLSVSKCGDSLYYVPEELKTEQLCSLAVEKN